MRLKSIKLAGFKSFVDPTVANFPNNLSAVVGPNGCGKSNIIDAIRWVMGESSAKHLRGESMTDVIFNGSTARKPVTLASVELLFDNSDATLRGEWVQFSEIAVKRQVTRDAQSTYFLNGAKCRRKDITDIFLGTGLGPRSYAIIEQGMISRLIESKPEELRVYVEEAAGISKYKERRRETENRMRRTRENLERLEDLREEMGRQLQHLQRQAGSAEKYKGYKQEERVVKAQLQALRWQSIDQEAKALEATIAELTVKLEATVADQRHSDAQIEESRELQIQLNDAFNEVQGRYYSLKAEIARLEQTIQHKRERTQQFTQDLRQTEEGWQSANEELQLDQQQVEELTEKIAVIQPEVELASEVSEVSQQTLLEAEEAMQQWQVQWDEFNQRSAEPRQKAEVEQSRIQHLEQSIQRIGQRIERLAQEQSNLSTGAVSEEVEELSMQQAELDERMAQASESQEGGQQQLNDLREKINQLNQHINEHRSQLQKLAGRQASLEALQQAAMGADEGVNQWLSQHGLDNQPRLAQQIKVSDGWELAVETVLADHLQGLCIEELDALADKLVSLDQGSVTLISNQTVTASGSLQGASGLAEFVQGPVSGLLAGIYVVEDLPAALGLRAQLNAHESIVTRDGLWVGSSWLRVKRSQDAGQGVLARGQELEQITQTLAQLEETLHSSEDQLQHLREERLALEQGREENQRSLSLLTREHGELTAQISARQVRLEQITMRRERLASEVEESQLQQKEEQEQLGEARMVLQEALELMAADTDQREILSAQRATLHNDLQTARTQGRSEKDEQHRKAMELQNYQTQLSALRSAMDRLRVQTESLQQRKTQIEDQMKTASEPTSDVEAQLEEFLEQHLVVEEELTTARAHLQQQEHQLRELEQGRSRHEQDAMTIRTNLEQRKMSWQALEVRRNTVAEQLTEEQFDLETVLTTLPEDASEAQWEQQVQSLANRISRLGPINLAAIDEYKTQSERKVYLDHQNDDLMEALKTLENAIRKIDRETRTRFKETFEKINSGLKDLFPKVFGGGHAYLELTGDDMLDSGVTIMARPPGKRNSTIHLLSGGEKALTALALVFSIFRLNPAPFCLLDEVDAPLDDANVGRFCNLVKQMSETVQFIYISHNKVAMEMADVLMGVTMHEPGCSRLVSVDVEEAAEMAAQ